MNTIATAADPNAISPRRLPVASVLAALVSFLALGLTLAAPWPMLALGLALAGSCLTDTRFDGRAAGMMAVRITLYFLVLLWSWRQLTGEEGIEPELMLAFGAGMGAACELVLQAWSSRPLGGRDGAGSVFFSAVVMMGASNTFDTAYIRLLVPAYMILLCYALRAHGSDSQTTAIAKGGKDSRRGLANLCIALAITTGASFYTMVWANRFELGQMGARFFNEHIHIDSGLSTAPRLGPAFGNSGAVTRMYRLTNWPATESYLRVMSFDTFVDRSWFPLIDTRKFAPVTRKWLFGSATTAVLVGGAANASHIERLVDDDELMAVPLDAATIAAPHGAETEWARGGPLRSSAPSPTPFVYDVSFADAEGDASMPSRRRLTTSLLGSHPLGSRPQGSRPLAQAPTAAELKKCLAIPAPMRGAVRSLALDIGKDCKSPLDKINAVESYLQSHNGYSFYSRPGAGDAVVNFILQKKAAHCEYFATAAAIMLRCLKVPTRYVIGYYVHEGDGPGAEVVRLRDAHAWCESYVAGTGWVTVEATPAVARPDEAFPPVSLWVKAREHLQDLVLWLHDVLVANLGRLRIILPLGGAAWLLLLGLRAWLRRRKARVADFEYSGSVELAPIARRFEKLLRRRRLACPPERPWRDHIESLADDGAARATIDVAAALGFVRLYNDIRFAGRESLADSRDGPSPSNSARGHMARLHELLRALEQNVPAKNGKGTS